MKKLYRIIAQTDEMTISADTSKEMSDKEAIEIAEQEILSPTGSYRNFIIQPLGTLHGWKYGHINFCPRCGKYIGDEMGDSTAVANNYQEFDCPECEAEVSVEIISTKEEKEDQDDYAPIDE